LAVPPDQLGDQRPILGSRFALAAMRVNARKGSPHFFQRAVFLPLPE
jgi:hypothetical protein